MIITRQDIEKEEKETLAPYAVKAGSSRGREYSESEDPYRTCFQRDRDRVIHAKAFRRLKGKTQVFIAGYGDHYRSRLLHSMEVAQLSRDIARTLALNEDLSEAIGLAHDLGHTPFGHAGQDAMHIIMQKHGKRFEHNEQSRRVVDHLEEKSPDYPGLNLSFEVRDGLLKHRTTYDKPEPGDTLMPSLEAQIVNLADEIAYMNHDIDDGLRSKILTPKNFETLKIWGLAKEKVAADLPLDHWTSAMISALVTLMVNDLVHETERRLKEKNITSIEQIYDTPEPLAGFSANMQAMTTELKTFLHKNFYMSPPVHEYNLKGQEVITALFEYFLEDSSRLPDKHREKIEGTDPTTAICDYIAGMTDGFALKLYDTMSL